MIDWPLPSFIGEIYTSPNGDNWEWNGKAWVGAGFSGPVIFGSNDVGVMYMKNNTLPTPITAINQRKVVVGTMSTGILNNFIKDPTTNSLKYTGDGGRFHIIITFNFFEGNQRTCGFYIGKNSNPTSPLDPDVDRISESEIYVNSSNPSSQPIGSAIQTILDLNKNDRIFFIVQNKDAASNITVEFMKMTVTSLMAQKGISGLTALANVLSIGNEALGQNIIMGGGSILSGTGQSLPIISDTSIISQAFDGINQASLNLNGNTGLLELSYIGQGRTALINSGSSSINIDFADGIFFQQEINLNNSRILLKSSDFLVGGGISSLELKGDSYSKLNYDFQGDITDLSLYSDRIEYKRTTQISTVPSVIYSSINGSTTNALPLSLVNINTGSLGDNVVTLEVIITGIELATSKSYGAKLFGTFRYFGGVLSLIGTVDKIEKSSFLTATSNLVISGANINIQVTGETSSNINWCARYNYQSAI